MSFCSCFGSRKKNKVKNDEEEEVNPETKSPEKQVPEEEPYSGAPEDNLNADNNNRSRIFSYKELLSATNNFASLIGEGGFGRVYKGRLPRSNQVIAVKKLNRFGTQGDSEFLVESHMLSVLSHPNLVTLIGYCSEGHQRLLVYEYMPLGSLADHLFEPSPFKNRLDWNTRMKIACGAARGVQYLHHQIDPPVIYRDLKSANILLGEGFDPKLSDFGLAKFGPTGDKTHVSTRVLGTYGYCAPEYAATGKLTLKSDIYSFGMVLLELITGRRALDDRRGQLKWLVNWVKPLLRDRSNFPFIADPLLKGEYPKDSLEHALEMAMMCLRSDAQTRPDMNDVVMGLEYLESLKYHPSNELTSLLNTKGKEREQAVAEAKIWGQSLRKGNQTASSSSTSSSSNPN